jgi:dedicator of cytokinesis protein 3
MPWTPLPRIAFAIATQPFNPTTRDDLPLELGDELYIIEQCADGAWYRGYLVPPPSLLAGLTSTKGATLEARVFSGIFPACCVKVREFLSVPLPAGEAEGDGGSDNEIAPAAARNQKRSRSRRKRDEVVRANSVRRREDRARPAAPVPMLKVGDETSSYEGEPLVDEIASCLKEWHAANLHELLLNREYTLLDEVSALVQQLDLSRRQLLYNVLTRTELVKLREETVWRLVRGNKLLSREIIVRNPHSGRILTGEDSSVEVTTLQSVMSLLDEPPKMKGDDVGKKHHLQIEQKGFVGRNEPVSVFYYLATKSNRAVSEMFVVELNSKGQPVDAAQAGRLQALFMDISTRDTEDLYLVARVYTNGFISATGPNAGNRVPEPTKPPSVISREEKKLKGRVSVLFNSRPRTAGKENDSKPSTSHSTKSQGESRPGSATSTPPVPTLQATKVPFRKAVGVGVLDVGRFIKQEQSTEQIMHILVSNHIGMERAGERGGGRNNDGENWDRLVRDVIESRTKSPAVAEPLQGTRYRSPTLNDGRSLNERNAKMDKLHLYLRPFAANDGEELIKSTPTILHQVVPTRKIGFSGAPTKSRSDIYITLNSLSLPRHALLIHPKLGSSPMPPSSHFNQLQLSMEVRRATGERITGCIFPSSGPTGMTVYKSAVVTREEPWSQTVRLSLNDDDVPNAHVFLSISGIPNPPAAMAWFPLWDQGAFLRDGDHDLVLHKYDEHTAHPRGTASESGYISQPWTPGEEGWAAALNMGGVAAYVKVRSYLCSTEFSQDDVLLPLLRWKELDQRRLIDVLKKAGFIPEIEIVKLLREVFDALFGILVENTTKAEIEDLVFYALITVLGIVYDRRFNMEPIVDKYAEEMFDYPFAAPCLIRSFTRLLNDPLHMENSVRLRAAFKVGKHIFRFIVKAREKQVLKEATIGINATQSFTKDLRGIFKLLERLMLNSERRLVGSQTLAVQHFSQWLPELMGVLTREEISLVAIDFMDACSDVAGKLVLYKLLLIVNYSRSDLFSQPEDRRALTVNTIRWLEPHWGKTDRVTEQYREQVRLCCSVLAEQVDELTEVSEYIPKIVDSYRSIQATGVQPRDSLSLLFPKTYPFPTKPINGRPVFDEALAELAAIIAAMSNIPSSLHLVLPEEELTAFLMDTLKVHKSILSCEAFPVDWLSVHIYQHKSTMRTLETLAGILVDSFLPDPDDADKFNMELWQSFFSTLLQLVGSDALALETFPEQKRRAVWKVGGDVREQGADLLRRTWEAIGWETSPEEKQTFMLEKMGGFQVQYVPGLVAPIVELCLSVHEGLRSVAVEVLQTMVVSEWSLNEDLSVIQAEMIDVSFLECCLFG